MTGIWKFVGSSPGVATIRSAQLLGPCVRASEQKPIVRPSSGRNQWFILETRVVKQSKVRMPVIRVVEGNPSQVRGQVWVESENHWAEVH